MSFKGYNLRAFTLIPKLMSMGGPEKIGEKSDNIIKIDKKKEENDAFDIFYDKEIFKDINEFVQEIQGDQYNDLDKKTKEYLQSSYKERLDILYLQLFGKKLDKRNSFDENIKLIKDEIQKRKKEDVFQLENLKRDLGMYVPNVSSNIYQNDNQYYKYIEDLRSELLKKQEELQVRNIKLYDRSLYDINTYSMKELKDQNVNMENKIRKEYEQVFNITITGTEDVLVLKNTLQEEKDKIIKEYLTYFPDSKIDVQSLTIIDMRSMIKDKFDQIHKTKEELLAEQEKIHQKYKSIFGDFKFGEGNQISIENKQRVINLYENYKTQFNTPPSQENDKKIIENIKKTILEYQNEFGSDIFQYSQYEIIVDKLMNIRKYKCLGNIEKSQIFTEPDADLFETLKSGVIKDRNIAFGDINTSQGFSQHYKMNGKVDTRPLWAKTYSNFLQHNLDWDKKTNVIQQYYYIINQGQLDIKPNAIDFMLRYHVDFEQKNKEKFNIGGIYLPLYPEDPYMYIKDVWSIYINDTGNLEISNKKGTEKQEIALNKMTGEIDFAKQA